MRREIPGIDALAKVFPKEWLLYASLNCYPRAQAPMEIDAVVVMDDRVLLLELKDWNGKLTQRGDQWFVGGQSRGRSPVIVAEEKAKKLKTVLKTEIPALKNLWVDGRVVLTASSTRDGIADHEKRFVWTLPEACSLADPRRRVVLLPQTKLGLLKAYKFEQDFDRVTNNPKIFQPLEADWGGYRVSEPNIVVHPDEVWREHRAERHGEGRIKALLRVWSFDRLPPGLNSPDRRKLIAEREIRVFAHLTTSGSPLVERNAIFRDIGPNPAEILTNHFDLRALPLDWVTWDRFLERSRDDLDSSDQILLATTLLWLVSELHKSSVTHRDLGPRSIWVGSPAKMALNGFMCCQLPGEETVEDWLAALRGYAPEIPDDKPTVAKSPGKQRDVYLVGRLVADALGAKPQAGNPDAPPALPPEFHHIQDWVNKALATRPENRFPDAIEMAGQFAALAESVGTTSIDQALLDRHETSSIPFVVWPAKSFYVQDARRSVYLSVGPNESEAVVKVWHGLRRNVDASTDLALIRLLESASRVSAMPIQGLPHFLEVGLSPVGPYVVYRHEDGKSLDQLGPLPVIEALSVCAQLLTTVTALHDLACEHGDIAAKNVLFDSGTKRLCIMDAFDISPIGDGIVRTPTLCPENWEVLSQQCLDRYAALKVVSHVLEQCGDPVLADAITGITQELARPVVETLEVALQLINRATVSIAQPPTPSFVLTDPSASEKFFQPDGDGYFLTRRSTARDSFQYCLTGIDRELVLPVRNGVLTAPHFIKTSFGALSYASRNGIKVAVTISVTRGPESGFSAFYEFVKERTDVLSQLPSSETVERIAAFDIPRYWDRLLELEANDRLEIEIVEEIAFGDGLSVYTFQSYGQVLDFDPESSIDAYLPPNKRIGELDQGFVASTNTLAIRNASRRLSAGDTIFLVDRREQTSIDRRSKAVRKILERQATVPNLIDYFAIPTPADAIDYGVEIEEADLKSYGLNLGQEDAFRHLLRYGPVGLLQGPPGTGKTRFIASLVHWLMDQGGARRILIASQSHEAVNNAIESLVDLYKRRGKKPNLLRIGSKGITDKIRPYHSAELRDRYRLRFQAAIKFRVSILGSERGISRQFTAAVFEIDEKVGAPARLCQRFRRLAEESGTTTALERDRYASELRRAEVALKAAAAEVAGLVVDENRPLDALEAAYRALLKRHQGASESDLVVIRQMLDLANEWVSSMGSIYRNFDEFLAKTRGIVTATCVGVGETKIRIDTAHFDWVIVDEAARCTPSELAVPIQMGRRVLLVGDHLQLMPMIKRSLVDELQEEFPDVPRDDLVRSDFERAFLSVYGSKVGRRLTEQYRMDPQICELVSRCFYEPNAVTLRTSPERTPTLEIPLDGPTLLAKPICWVDTARAANSQESQLPNSTTFHNDAEVHAVLRILDSIAQQERIVEQLLGADDETPIGVICMYSGQKRRLEVACARHVWAPRFRKLVRVDTVDAYQGKENTIVILSLVRSNDARVSGHVRNENRCNVAISRARERLIIVGSSAMWGAVPQGSPVRRTLEHIRSHTAAANVIPVEALQ